VVNEYNNKFRLFKFYGKHTEERRKKTVNFVVLPPVRCRPQYYSGIDKIKTNRMKRGLSILCNRIHGNGLSHRPQAKRWRKFGERFKLLKSKLSQFISFTFMSRSIVVKSNESLQWIYGLCIHISDFPITTRTIEGKYGYT
jgi:hypothetical protein